MPHIARRSRIAALLSALFLLIGPHALPVQHAQARDSETAQNAPNGPRAARLRAAKLTLENPAAPEDERTRAAALLLLADDPEIRDLLRRALLRDQPQGVRAAVALAASGPEQNPEFLAQALGIALARAQPGELPTLLPAFRTLRSPEAVGSVIGLLKRDPPPPSEALETVFDTLRHQTARTDLPDAVGPWLAWWETHADDTPAEWYESLADAQARRIRETEAHRDLLVADVERLYRQLHALTPLGERSPLIAELIRDERPLLARIGFELAHRTLLNARTLGPGVVDAAKARIDDPDVRVRREAASLLDRVDPEGAGEVAAGALHDEQDPTVAAALLRILSRRPQPGTGGIIAEWAARPGPAHAPAIAAAYALRNAGLLGSPELRGRIADSVRAEIEAGQPSVAGVRFLAAEGDTTSLPPLLDAENREIAGAVAEALALSPDHLDVLLHAARTHPDLHDAAAQAIGRHRPTAGGVREVLDLPAPTPSEKRRAVVRLAPELAPPELLDAARIVEDPELRGQMMAHVASPAFMSEPDHPEARRTLLRMLLLDLLRVGAPEAVLQTLDALGEVVETDAFAELRVGALLRLGRIGEGADAAGDEGASPDVWLDALRASMDRSFAPELAQSIRERFGDRLTDTQRARLEAIEEELSAAAPASADPVGEADLDDAPADAGGSP